MSDTPNQSPSVETILNVLIKNAETMAALNATIAPYHQEAAVNRQTLRDHSTNVCAKIDNLDRSISELRLLIENAEKARQSELTKIFDLLGEERKDRKETSASVGKEERDLIQNIVKTELGDRRQERNLIVSGFQAVWHVGGKYIVLAISLLFIAIIMKITGISLVDIIGMANK